MYFEIKRVGTRGSPSDKEGADNSHTKFGDGLQAFRTAQATLQAHMDALNAHSALDPEEQKAQDPDYTLPDNLLFALSPMLAAAVKVEALIKEARVFMAAASKLTLLLMEDTDEMDAIDELLDGSVRPRDVLDEAREMMRSMCA